MLQAKRINMIWDMNQFSANTAVIVESGEQITYQELQYAGDELCDVIDTRCLIFNMCDNVLGSLLGYTAFLNHDIVPVMLNVGLDWDLFGSLLEVYQPAYVWTPEDQTTPLDRGETVYKKWGYQLIRTGYESARLHNELALLMTTSGSTGSPKFVRQSYRNILANTKSIMEYLQLDEDERAITTLPMNYTYGISIINTHLMVGATILLTNKGVMQKEFWDFFREQKATSFGGVPYTYEMLKRLHIFNMYLPSLTTMTQAGGKLSPDLHKEYATWALETGRKFVVMYGQCEATARMAYLPVEKSVEKAGSIGIAIPGGRFALVDADGRAIEGKGITGELIYYGENVALGYAQNQADLLLGDEQQGKLETGDMARRDADGYFYIVGRKKRFLKIFGNRVNLDEVEQMLREQFPEAECACSGVDDCLVIYTTNENAQRDMREYLTRKTGLNSSAFRTKYLSQLPRNESGKTLYQELE